MSSAVPTYPVGSVPPGVAPAAVPFSGGPVPDEEIRVYGHSNLFYWWPVWAVAFLMAGLTFLDGHVMAIVPRGTMVEQGQTAPGTDKTRDVLLTPPGETVPPATATNSDPSPRLRVAANNNYGVVFTGVLLLVVTITNLTLRGLASVIAIAVLVILGLVVALFGWWDQVLFWLGGVDVRMNAGGYLAIGIPLFLIWAFSTFIYDHYTYLIVTRGQVRIRREIGDGELAVDTSGLLLEKKRDDLFRHWLLGLGSGDLHVKTGGPANLDFELNNVLFIGSKMARIQDLIREKEIAPQAATA
ncbi:Uncharacterized protein OS=Singulisphaera acidiphila (strain ATCC BAA-1392 / DSM 18658 / VKM B-2454 / MOB10) GN=Sinac_0896 PE=4 SV=1 [Gemmata massiliana]|uniref:Uncharacterized protein n=1 Tax=Gemmata massiliana TaxID=1210884 RepID=A0A6P2DDD9_9BACT|nr:hypothetical protein [Gemmata massiliana]VTR99401.1 Uncharacterized protein OS=Singulisphaera acidiphila (strain ATCC BAA-1392 / DSM 18658 / VKM B-2454 / MOB10) GN=Sinac_0896 PE=4 SV=1 [Gemmata massiliana]